MGSPCAFAPHQPSCCWWPCRGESVSRSGVLGPSVTTCICSAHAVPYLLSLVSASWFQCWQQISLICGDRTALQGVSPGFCHSYMSRGFSLVRASAEKALGILLHEGQMGKWNTENTKTVLSFCAECVRKPRDTYQTPTAVFAAGWQQIHRQSPECVIRLPGNCCTMLLDMLKTVQYLISNAGSIFQESRGVFAAESEQPAVPRHLCGWTFITRLVWHPQSRAERQKEILHVMM